VVQKRRLLRSSTCTVSLILRQAPREAPAHQSLSEFGFCRGSRRWRRWRRSWRRCLGSRRWSCALMSGHHLCGSVGRVEVDKACALHVCLKCSSSHLLHKNHHTRSLGLLLGVPIHPRLDSHVLLRLVLLCVQITRLLFFVGTSRARSGGAESGNRSGQRTRTCTRTCRRLALLVRRVLYLITVTITITITSTLSLSLSLSLSRPCNFNAACSSSCGAFPRSSFFF
jgi:hypothetical protein